MTRQEAIEELNHIIQCSPKEPPEDNDDVHWERDHKIFIGSLEMAIKTIDSLDKIEKISNRYWHGSHYDEIGDREALRMIYDVLSDLENKE